MANQNAGIDDNFTKSALAVSSSDNTSTVTLYANPTTHRLLVDAGGSISGHFKTDPFTSTNNQTIFTASQTPLATIYLSVNGAIYTPSSDYSVVGDTATLASGIPAGNVVLWCYIY